MIKRFGAAAIGLAAFAAACSKDASGPTGEGFHLLSGLDATSLVDTTVAHPPSMLLLDAASKPRAGVAVSFTVIAGGGAVSDSVVSTDASGKAALGFWKLGPTPIANRLVVSAAGAVPETLVVQGNWFRTMASAAQTVCVTKSLKVYCWGDNNHREYGVVSSWTPTPLAMPLLPANQHLDEIDGTYGQHFCGRSVDGFAVCWGRNDFGQAGGMTGSVTTAQALFGHTWRSVSVGRITTCAIEMSGGAFCWGANQRGEIGNPAALAGGARYEAPTKVLAPENLTQVSAGWQHACGLSENGTAYCWGANLDGQLGIGVTDSTHPTPMPVLTSEKFASIAAGGRYTCAITLDGRAFCWGQNQFGQLGDGSTTSRLVPTAVAGGFHFTNIAVGTYFVAPLPPEMSLPPRAADPAHTCALTESGAAYCWGWNGWGQLGDNTLVDRLTPTPILGALVFNGISLGEISTCGARGTTVWCWGGNTLGQLGDGTQIRRPSPGLALLP